MSKPCEMPCEKCGSGDVSRLFHAKGASWRVAEYGRARNRFASAASYLATATRDHIAHTCRCCRHTWQTPPMRKPKKADTPPAARRGEE